jgi:small subunit ribosomal protein S16
MVSIRLQRVGRRGDPAHRVVVQESSRAPQSGNYIEILGSYNPRKEGSTIDTDRATYWVEQGAQISQTVHNLFVDLGVINESKVNSLPQKSPVEPEQSEEEAAAEGGEGEAEAEATEGEGAEESGGESAEGESSQEGENQEAEEASAVEGSSDDADSNESGEEAAQDQSDESAESSEAPEESQSESEEEQNS